MVVIASVVLRRINISALAFQCKHNLNHRCYIEINHLQYNKRSRDKSIDFPMTADDNLPSPGNLNYLNYVIKLISGWITFICQLYGW